MGLIKSFIDTFRQKAQASQPDPADNFWYAPVDFAPSATGDIVTPDTALKVAAVKACVTVLSEDLAKLPLILYRRRSDGGKDRATDHSLYTKLHDRPNRWQTRFEFVQCMQINRLLRGNAYAEILYKNGRIDQLIPRNPDYVKVEQLEDYSLRYQYFSKGQWRTILQDNMLHIRYFSIDGITGIGPIKLHRDTIGLGIAGEKFAANAYGSGGLKRTAIKKPDYFKNVDTGKLLAQSWREAYGGVNNGKVVFLEGGAEPVVIGMTLEDAQYIEGNQFNIEQICRMFRVPPHKIQHLLRATNNNIEHQGMEYVGDSLLPHCVQWEGAISRDLLYEDEQSTFFAEFLTDALLRGDTATRYEGYSKAINTGWMNRNEVRIRENMDPVDGLDDYLMPVNMAIVGKQNPQPTPEEQADKEDKQFKREVVKSYLADGTTVDVMANLTNLRTLMKDVDLPIQEGYEEPWLPVQADNLPLVSGEAKKDSAGDIVGGDIEREGNAENDQSGSDDSRNSEVIRSENGEDLRGQNVEGEAAERGQKGVEPKEAKANNLNLDALIDDAAGRIARAEIREVEKHITLEGDKWNAWVQKFYPKHFNYIRSVCATIGIELGSNTTIGRSATLMDSMNQTDDRASCFNEIKTDWPTHLANILKAKINDSKNL